MLFNRYDKNHNGTISKRELGRVLRDYGMSFSNDDLDIIHQKIDRDNSGTIDKEEFMTLIIELSRQMQKKFRTVFNAMDDNGDGNLDRNELKRALGAIGEAVDDDIIDQMFRLADLDGNGVISYTEFLNIFN
ncbi:hypothetical protein SNEBB_000509 [Seison nebaliae]|nr:hypothetical protein SNEBB_000509 [Seison nebaliae]